MEIKGKVEAVLAHAVKTNSAKQALIVLFSAYGNDAVTDSQFQQSGIMKGSLYFTAFFCFFEAVDK